MMYSVWVCLHKSHGWVLTGNCTCMSGLGSACSHVAALLFKLEAAVHLDMNQNEAPTTQLCAWRSCKKQVEPAPMSCINFKKPKRGSLPNVNSCRPRPEAVDNTNVGLSFSYNLDATNDVISNDQLKLLYDVSPQSTVFTSVNPGSFGANPVCPNDSDTESDDENDQNVIPEPLTSLYDPVSINYSPPQLHLHGEQCILQYSKCYNQASFDNLCNLTEKQALSRAWYLHRAGRITASLAHTAFHTSLQKPSESFISTVMQYRDNVETKYTSHGKRYEPVARSHYIDNYSKDHNSSLKVKEVGLVVRADVPFLGASPDGIVSCSCHTTRLLEIKCPFKYKDDFKGWETDDKFPINKDYLIKKSHPYYCQIQLQMYLCDLNLCDLYIFSPASGAISCTVERDNEIIGQMLNKFRELFMSVILPEIITRKRDFARENDRKLYCICRRPSFGPMIGCDNPSCTFQWFHYPCVHITRAPKGKWFCEYCKIKPSISGTINTT